MPIVHIPSLMHDITNGAARVAVAGATLREVIESLDAKFPGIKQRLCDGERIHPHLSVWVDGEITREGMIARIEENSEIHFLPAISGG